MERCMTDIYIYICIIVIELTSVHLAHNGPNYSWGSRLRWMSSELPGYHQRLGVPWHLRNVKALKPAWST